MVSVDVVVPMPHDVVLPLGGSGGVLLDGPLVLTPMPMPAGGVGLGLSALLH